MDTIEARMEIVNESLQMVAAGQRILIQIMRRIMMRLKIRKEVRIQITTPTMTKKVTMLIGHHYSTAEFCHPSL